MALLEYVWLDASGNMRSKTKVMENAPESLTMNGNIKLSQLPSWNYDGSSTGQADGSNSEVIIKPCAVFNDPFREGHNSKLVLCDTYLPNSDPHPDNTRYHANRKFNKALELSPLFGIEQEFFITKDGWPIGFPENRIDNPAPQGAYYCGVGESALGRDCVEKAFIRSLNAGLYLTGMNAEVAPSQWEIQVSAHGINCADQLVILRYILNRTAEDYGCGISFDPKPVSGDWNGSGCHTNFSTGPMRDIGGYDAIMSAVTLLGEKHDEHMEVYGDGNRMRMTGQHETASYDNFSFGVADRGASVRIPRETEKNKRGYLEDRRPASNMDPYVVTSMIFETCCL